MLLWLKNNAVSLKEASKKSPEELEGKILTDELVNRERPELSAQYRQMIEALRKEGGSNEV